MVVMNFSDYKRKYSVDEYCAVVIYDKPIRSGSKTYQLSLLYDEDEAFADACKHIDAGECSSAKVYRYNGATERFFLLTTAQILDKCTLVGEVTKEGITRSDVNESRGVVTNNNSWSGVVDYICKHSDKYLAAGKHNVDASLPAWMKSLTVNVGDYAWGLGAYDDEASTMDDGGLNVVVNLSSSIGGKDAFRSSLEHELQHAYDDFIARSKRGMKNEMGDMYCFPVGEPFEDVDFGKLTDIKFNPSKTTQDDVFHLFRQCTYFFELTEVNAYSREFSLYLKNKLQNGNISFGSILANSNESGGGPLMMLDLMHSLIDNWKYIPTASESETGVDWEYTNQCLQDPPKNFSKRYLGKRFANPNPALAVVDIAKCIVERSHGKKCLDRFKRIISDVEHSTGHKVTDKPSWL